RRGCPGRGSRRRTRRRRGRWRRGRTAPARRGGRRIRRGRGHRPRAGHGPGRSPGRRRCTARRPRRWPHTVPRSGPRPPRRRRGPGRPPARRPARNRRRPAPGPKPPGSSSGHQPSRTLHGGQELVAHLAGVEEVVDGHDDRDPPFELGGVQLLADHDVGRHGPGRRGVGGGDPGPEAELGEHLLGGHAEDEARAHPDAAHGEDRQLVDRTLVPVDELHRQTATGTRSWGAGALGVGCRRARPWRPAMVPPMSTAATVSHPKTVTKASSNVAQASGWWMNMMIQLMTYQSGSARVASSGAVPDSSVQVTAWPMARNAPVMAPPRMAAFQPPGLLPKTPAAPPGKNSMIIGGTITIQSMAAKNAISTRNMAVADRKPIITEDGAPGNTVGQSRAGRAPGMTRSLIPLKAGTTSARNIRTPKRRMAIPAANLSDWITPHTQGLTSGS